MYEIYDCKENETIEDIAKKYNTNKQNLCMINGFENDIEFIPNMQVIVPKNNTDYWYYTVKNGDNSYDIAKKYHIDINTFFALNGLDKDGYIYPNQTLLIPKQDVFVYFTKEGDTLREILDKYQLDCNELVDFNENIYLCSNQFITFRKK